MLGSPNLGESRECIKTAHWCFIGDHRHNCGAMLSEVRQRSVARPLCYTENPSALKLCHHSFGDFLV